MPVTRMIIGEAATDDLATEVIAKMHEHVRTLTGPIKHSILVEEGGRMVILITKWPNREQCLAYHATRAYRHLVAGTQHMLIGDWVVNSSTTEPIGLTSSPGKARFQKRPVGSAAHRTKRCARRQQRRAWNER